MTTYRVHLLEDLNSRYWGEVWEDGILLYRGEKMASKTIAIRHLNRKINELNTLKGSKISKYVDKPKSAETPPAPKPEPKLEPKPNKPKRKPFTPYGLNGYLVDKNGNVRLHLDRKANAHTIVLSPEMFARLAEMVKATQAQGQKQ